MKVTMVGAGYVGLVSGACFADFGHEVCCVDTDAGRVGALQAGRIPIFEPGLEALVATNVRAGRLTFTTELAVEDADAIFIAVGTPSRRGDGHADLSYVHAAARDIARAVSGFKVVVTKSTVPVGTGDEVERIIRAARPGADVAVVSNPEFLREGAAIDDFKQPDRIVIGTDDRRAEEVMRELYRPLSLNGAPILVTSRRTAELTKYAANAFLATKITFINEVADLCERVGADVGDVARGIGLDSRIGPDFLRAGPGYGGSCFPKDTSALVRTGREYGTPLSIVEAVKDANEARKSAIADRIAAACEGTLSGRTIAILGLTFKPNTDDMRDAPSLTVVPALQAAGARVRAFDPEGARVAAPLLPGIEHATDPYDCAKGADALVILTEWDLFRALDLDRIRAAMAAPVVVDLRNVYRPEDMRRGGFRYHSVGRSPVEGGQEDGGQESGGQEGGRESGGREDAPRRAVSAGRR